MLKNNLEFNKEKIKKYWQEFYANKVIFFGSIAIVLVAIIGSILVLQAQKKLNNQLTDLNNYSLPKHQFGNFTEPGSPNYPTSEPTYGYGSEVNQDDFLASLSPGGKLFNCTTTTTSQKK